MPQRLMSIETGSNAEVVAKMLAVLFPDSQTVLDMTYGSGAFWPKTGASAQRVIRMDRDPSRGKDLVADFQQVPLVDGGVDVAIFDPPFQSNPGKGKQGIMSGRFKAYPTVEAMEAAVKQGTQEAWRVARLGVIIKVQDHIHSSRLVRMTKWVEEALPAQTELYDVVHKMTGSKVIDGKWGRQLSAWRNNSTFLIWRKDGPVHKGRKPR